MFNEMRKRAKILIVDDQEANLSLLERILEREGYTQVRSTLDSRQTLALYADFAPDLILLDLLMPHLDGFAVLEQLRPAIPADSYLPILVLTADITAEAKQRALASGAKDFLTKPLDVVEVLLRIKNLLETRLLHLQLQNQNQLLEAQVRERTAELTHANAELTRANTQLQAEIAERQQAQEEIKRRLAELEALNRVSTQRLHRLTALRAIDVAITSSLDLKLTLDVVLDQVTARLSVDAAAILLLNPATQLLEYAAGRGFRTNGITHSKVRLGQGHAGRAALERRIVNIPDINQTGSTFVRGSLLAGEGFVAYYGAPLIAKGVVRGVLDIFHCAPLTPDPDWLAFLEALAGQAAIAIDNAELFTSLQRSNDELALAYDTTLEGWSRAMDLRDKETEGHTQRVTEMTVQLAQAMRLSQTDIMNARRGALLHDMGKLGIPDSILLKPGKLTDEEWVIMKKHPTYAYEMLSPIGYLRPALDVPYCHHEKWDGTGYPRGLKGEQIPLAARIFAVADVWDALRSDRPYRTGWPEQKVRDHIREQSGTHFDPQVVDTFLKVVSPV